MQQFVSTTSTSRLTNGNKTEQSHTTILKKAKQEIVFRKISRTSRVNGITTGVQVSQFPLLLAEFHQNLILIPKIQNLLLKNIKPFKCKRPTILWENSKLLGWDDGLVLDGLALAVLRRMAFRINKGVKGQKS